MNQTREKDVLSIISVVPLFLILTNLSYKTKETCYEGLKSMGRRFVINEYKGF